MANENVLFVHESDEKGIQIITIQQNDIKDGWKKVADFAASMPLYFLSGVGVALLLAGLRQRLERFGKL